MIRLPIRYLLIFATATFTSTLALATSPLRPCQFKAGGESDPFARFLADGKVVCSDKSAKVSVPTNVFWASDNAIHPDVRLLKNETPQQPAAAALVQSAGISFKVAEDERVAIYLPSTASIIPLPRTSPIIPAATSFVPLLINDRGKIVAVASERKVSAGAVSHVVFDRKTSVVVLWIKYSLPATPPALPPNVALRTPAGKKISPLSKIQTLREDDMPLAIFSGIAEGDYEAVVEGPGWATTHRRVNVAGPVSVVVSPLQAAGARRLTVEWTVVDNPAELSNASTDECVGADDASSPSRLRKLFSGDSTATRAEIVLMDCNPREEREGSSRCIPAQRQPVDVDNIRGTAVFTNVPPGAYKARFHYPNLPAIDVAATVAIDEDAVVDLSVQYAKLFGRITRGGEPARALVDFGSAVALSDEHTGEYRVVVDRFPGTSDRVQLSLCENARAYQFFPSEKVEPGNRLDIDIPLNKIELVALDTESGLPVASADVNFSVLVGDNSRAARMGGRVGKTDADGQFSIEPVDPSVYVTVCADHEDYERKCVTSFKVGKDETRRESLLLNRIASKRGKVVPERSATLWWWDLNGKVTEVVHAQTDGTFVFKKDHRRDFVAVAIQGMPFFALSMPEVAGEVFIVPAPNAPVRTLQLNPQPGDWYVTLAVGNVLIPGNVFLNMASSAAVSEKGRHVFVPPFFETAETTALLLQMTPQLERVDTRTYDFFYAPESQPFIQRRPVTESIIQFGRISLAVK